MKILIISDTHGRHRNLEKVLERETEVEMMLHLGDVEGGEDYIEALVDYPVRMIAGNNDFLSDLPRELEFELEGHHVMMTHGHSYYVSLGGDELQREAKRRGADIAMYGHTHKPFCMEVDGVLLLNPGSISFPRQPGREGTYMIMDIVEGKKPRVELRKV